MGQEGLVSVPAADVGDKGRLIPSVSSLQVSASGASVLYRQVLVTLWRGRRTWCSDNAPRTVILETKFAEVGGVRGGGAGD